MKILIADDRPVNLKILRVTLQSEGHTVLEAADGAEALRLLNRETVDAIISDILMPNLDGYRLCLEVRRHPKQKTLPIILYSNTHLSPGDRQLALDLGADAFLEKPATVASICELLRKVTLNSSPRVSSEPPEDLAVMKQYSELLIRKLEERNVELKQRTEELQESEEKFRQMAENSGELFWMMDRKRTRMLYVSPAYQQIWGRTCKELYEQPSLWLDSIHPEDRERVEGSLIEERYLKGWYDEEYRITRPDRSTRFIHNRVFPVRDSRGEVYRLTGVSEDVTDRRSLETQFRQAQKMEAVGRLAGGVAHDFNNLLVVIGGYSQLILERFDPRDPAHKDVQEIIKAGERAAGLTRQLLAFSRKQVLQPRVVILNKVVSELEKLLRRLIGEDVELVVRLASDLGCVKVDLGQVEQVIVNLSVNARDAMPKGGRLALETSNVELDHMYASVHREVAPGRYVMLAVTDTGTGMSDEVKAHLFEPFFTTKESGKGTGLGLSTVYGIVKQSGGHVGVYSEAGRGSTFKVYFPRVDEPAESLRPTAGKQGSPRGTETILVVEDQENVRALLCTFLKASGYVVLEARHGGEALLLCERHKEPIHLVVTDVVMPQMSGPEMMVRLAVVRPDIRVVFMSGYTDATVSWGGHLDPDTPFLQKPFTQAALLGKVREALDASKEGTH